MARGRPRKPTELHVVEGTFRHYAHADRALEPKPEALTEAPEGLSDGAAEWWCKRVHRMAAIGVATEADVESLVLMAECWAALEQSMAAIRSDPLDRNNRTTFLAYQDAWSKLAGKFGLTPADRAKVVVVPKDTEGDVERRFFG